MIDCVNHEGVMAYQESNVNTLLLSASAYKKMIAHSTHYMLYD